MNAVADAEPEELPRATLVAYGIPMAAFMAVTIPFSLYLMKYSVDVLLISPAVMGFIVGASRVWDALTDPIAGYLSDRTRSRLGRRRIWMLASVLPIVVTIVMVWSPPAALEGTMLAVWIAVALILYETASTAFIVPYAALGMELTEDYRERTRVFAWRHLIGAGGFALALGFVYGIRTAAAPREAALGVSAVLGILVIVTVLYSVSKLREPEAHQGRGGGSVVPAFKDVFQNPHARILFLVYAIESFGTAAISALSPFVMEYVVKQPELLEVLILCYVIPQFALTPLWIRLSRRIGKREMWLAGMAILVVAFSGMAFLDEGRSPLALASVLLIGVGSGIASVVAPAVQADVIDFDELRTGERKEGAYTAVWNFIRKSGWGLAAGFTGLLLGASGYEANAEQSPEVVRTILILIGVVPAVAYVIGFLLFRRFQLNEREHQSVLAALEARRRASPPIG